MQRISIKELPNLKKKRNKYNNKTILIEEIGIKARSLKEYKYYRLCEQLVKSGKLSYFLYQVPIRTPTCKYVVDFILFHVDGKVEYIDTKGVRTDGYKIRKKSIEHFLPIKIIEV